MKIVQVNRILPRLMLVGTCGFLLFKQVPAHAGSYSVTYSGGSGVLSGVNSGSVTSPYAASGGSYGVQLTNFFVSPDFPASAKCSGAITATFTWVPSYTGEPAPSCIIVKQSCSVSCSNTVWLGGSLDDGLGDTWSSSTGTSQTLSKTKYTAVSNPGLSFTISCSPQASSVDSGSLHPVDDLLTASVSYSASATPVGIGLTGPTADSSGALNMLIGQSCSASLSLPTGFSATYHQWLVSGDTFQTWQSTTPAIGTSPANANASYYDDSGPWNNATASWYWADTGAAGSHKVETVSCTTAVTPPGGGSTIALTASQSINVYIPNWQATGTGGTMYVNNNYTDGNDIYLWAGPLTGGRGMAWNASVTSPSPSLFGDGIVEIGQLITPGFSYTTPNSSNVSTNYAATVNGQKGVDNTWPYSGLQGSQTYSSGDSPAMDLTTLKATAATMNNAFTDYLMYEPPGSSQYVPVASFTWSTSATVSIPPTNDWLNFVNPAGTVSPTGAAVNFTASNDFASWTQNSGSAAITYVAQ